MRQTIHVRRPDPGARPVRRGRRSRRALRKRPPESFPLLPSRTTPRRRVLLIGDSISIGYTLPTRKLLEGKANVQRIPTNGGPTTNGLKNLSALARQRQVGRYSFQLGFARISKRIQGRQATQVLLAAYEKNLG